MLYREIMAVYGKKRKVQVSTECKRMYSLMVNLAVRILTAAL
jgi:hypothetical protein